MVEVSETVHLQQKLEIAVASQEFSRVRECLGSLDRLEISLGMLRESKVGATVSKLKKHSDNGVSTAAKALVKKWKKVAEAAGVVAGATPSKDLRARNGKVAAGGPGAGAVGAAGASGAASSLSAPNGNKKGKAAKVVPGNGGAGGGSEGTSSTASPSTASESTKRPAAKVADEGPAAKVPRQESGSSVGKQGGSEEADGVLVEDGLPPQRLKMRRKLLEVLVIGFDGTDRRGVAAVARMVEEAMDANSPYVSKKEDYLAKARQLVFNLKKNDELRSDVRAGFVAAERLVVMTSNELMSREKREQMDKASNDRTEARMLDWADKNQDIINKQCGIKEQEGMFECGRCKSTKTTYFQKQTRSADEPMTTFVTCTNCRNRWKFC